MLLRVTLPFAAAHFVNQAARTVMAIVGPVLAVELGLSAVELGTLAACMFAAYAVTQLPLGVALDAFGARRVQVALMALAALGFATFALSPGFAGLALGRVLLGVGISAGLMAVLKGNADWFERRRVAQVIGISTAIAAVGSTVTTVPVQALLPMLGWRGVFWVLSPSRSRSRSGSSCRCPKSRAGGDRRRRSGATSPRARASWSRRPSGASARRSRPSRSSTSPTSACGPDRGCATLPAWTGRPEPACCSSTRWR